jgi:hypothetical protein
MRPLESEIGVVLEPADIVAANKMRIFLKNMYENGKPVEDQNPNFMPPLRCKEGNNLELDESAAYHILQQASLASRESTRLYISRDCELNDLWERHFFETEHNKELEAALSELADRIRIFGSLATAVQDNLSQSELQIMVYGVSVQ